MIIDRYIQVFLDTVNPHPSGIVPIIYQFKNYSHPIKIDYNEYLIVNTNNKIKTFGTITYNQPYFGYMYISTGRHKILPDKDIKPYTIYLLKLCMKINIIINYIIDISQIKIKLKKDK